MEFFYNFPYAWKMAKRRISILDLKSDGQFDSTYESSSNLEQCNDTDTNTEYLWKSSPKTRPKRAPSSSTYYENVTRSDYSSNGAQYSDQKPTTSANQHNKKHLNTPESEESYNAEELLREVYDEDIQLPERQSLIFASDTQTTPHRFINQSQSCTSRDLKCDDRDITQPYERYVRRESRSVTPELKPSPEEIPVEDDDDDCPEEIPLENNPSGCCDENDGLEIETNAFIISAKDSTTNIRSKDSMFNLTINTHCNLGQKSVQGEEFV